jgi:hypothetical protein
MQDRSKDDERMIQALNQVILSASKAIVDLGFSAEQDLCMNVNDIREWAGIVQKMQSERVY